VPVDAKDKDLTYKVAAIDGFSVFCDWHQIDLECNGGIDLKQLEDIKDHADPDNYFYKILAGEFSANALERVKTHKYLIDGFKVSLHLKLNKNIKFPSMPPHWTIHRYGPISLSVMRRKSRSNRTMVQRRSLMIVDLQ